ncbi:MAG: Hydroxypyruvate reductase [Phycisphaerae bacterium]|nr:Hydroxypyruvate reductase [Phycisphaerae bacterium]
MKVLIADKFEKEGIDGLKKLGCEVICNPEMKDEKLVAGLKELAPQVLVVRSTKVNGAMIKASPSLKLIVRAGSGVDNIEVPAATVAGVAVANCPGMNSVAVAELTFAFMLGLDRRLVHNTVDLRNSVWNKKEYSKARGLKGRTMGIVGLGQIGVEIAKRAKAFDMHLIYSDVITNEKAEKEYGIRKVAQDELFKTADFISLHVPLNEKTKHMIGAAQLAMMKPTTVLINCSRGGVVDEQALAAAVNSGKLGGAGLDVFETEPGANDTTFADPVIRCDRVYGTHHIGASTDQAQLAVAEETVRIVEEYTKTGQVRNQVNNR